MSEVHPANVTEFRGGRAKFHCWVRSTSLPQVEWLKRLPGHPLRPDLSLYPNTSLVVGEDHYQSIIIILSNFPANVCAVFLDAC